MIIRFLGLIIAISCTMLISCDSQKKQEDKPLNHGCLVLKDDLGRKINCPTNISRVMGLSPSTTEYLALICPNKIVARTQNCDFPTSISPKPIVDESLN